MDVFAAAKRQYRLQLRPDEVLAEAQWPSGPPRIEEVNAVLTQLAEWGNLQSQPDTARVSTLNDFYRARFLYRLSQGGEAVEAALAVFFQTLQRRAELQTVALEDIASRLQALGVLLDPEAGPDVAKVHAVLRDLVRVFESLADNAQAFMAGVARNIELQQVEATAVVGYKRRLGRAALAFRSRGLRKGCGERAAHTTRSGRSGCRGVVGRRIVPGDATPRAGHRRRGRRSLPAGGPSSKVELTRSRGQVGA